MPRQFLPIPKGGDVTDSSNGQPWRTSVRRKVWRCAELRRRGKTFVPFRKFRRENSARIGQAGTQNGAEREMLDEDRLNPMIAAAVHFDRSAGGLAHKTIAQLICSCSADCLFNVV